jgi:hypothetical protein
MKILFVEDELSRNIPRVVRLFEKFLGNSRIDRLNALEADPSGYGATPEEIKAIIDETGIVEAEFRFPEALRKISSYHDRYALFIVDRNLGEGDYRYQDALAADPDFSESHYEKYHEREGDYLLWKLAFRNSEVARRSFFFMTAYDAGYELKSAAGLQEFIDNLGAFKANNFIEKGNENHLERLKGIIENHRSLHLISDHQHHLNLVRKYLDEETAERFAKILLEKDEPKRIYDNLNEIRQVAQNFLRGFIIGFGDHGNAGDVGGFPVAGKQVRAGDLVEGKLPGAGHELLQAAGQLVRQGPEGDGAVGDVFHLFFADLFSARRNRRRKISSALAHIADGLGQFVPVAA